MRVGRGGEVGGASPPRPLVMETGATLAHNAPLFNTIPSAGLQTIRRTEVLPAVSRRRKRLCRADCGKRARSFEGLGRGSALQAALQDPGSGRPPTRRAQAYGGYGLPKAALGVEGGRRR